MPDTETCRVCHNPVLVMTRKGSGICGQTCENIEDPDHHAQRPQGSADLANAAEPARNEPECATS